MLRPLVLCVLGITMDIIAVHKYAAVTNPFFILISRGYLEAA
jgi:hypothetical protein